MANIVVRIVRDHLILSCSLLIVLLFFVWLGFEVFLALTAKPHPTVDYGAKLMQYMADWQGGEDTDDAWPVLMEVAELHQELLDELHVDQAGIVPDDSLLGYDAMNEPDLYPTPPLDGDWLEFGFATHAEAVQGADELQALIAESLAQWEEAGIIERLDTLAASRRAIRPQPDTTGTLGFSGSLKYLSHIRDIAQGLRARMALSREAGDWEAYVRAFEHGMTLGRISCSQGMLLETLVGYSIRYSMIREVVEDVLAGRLPSGVLVALDLATSRQSPLPPLDCMFEGMRATALDIVQWTHTSRGRIILSDIAYFIKYDFSNTPLQGIVNVASVVFPRKATVERQCNMYYDQAIAWYGLPVFERRGRESPVAKIEAEMQTDWRAPLQQVVVFPLLDRLVLPSDRLYVDELGFRTLIAVERFRHSTGDIPASLSELVPDFLDTAPVDPCADGVALLGYKVLEAPDELGRSYLLYSVGFDGVDDGGIAASEKVDHALQPDYPGTDYVINQAED